MLKVRRNEQRGRGGADWLESRHSFSFADYYDPAQMGFGPLRVINEDWIAPDSGFGLHGHKDMEIVTYMIDGALRHEDSLGHGGVIESGDVQRMTAGTGIRHSEINPSADTPAHLLQIWLNPEEAGLAPSYDQLNFSPSVKQGRLQLIVSGDGREGSLKIHRDADIHASLLEPGDTVRHPIGPDRKAWLQMVAGTVSVNGENLAAGDAVAIENESEITISADAESEFLLFDMAA
ncbi:MAG TPA: quercetin 2,3-dioxygenase [Rhodospirillaceae bacterium]|nr:quercetin 2,3-dioxygenase [Rhodospirillaceae bacterium]HAT34829.1 quercetin 2,3-dioxygenase [Rhodospirillaceae bacterium]